MQERFITQDFASPAYCKALQNAGIYHHCNFTWKKFDDQNFELWSESFDPDDYYKDGNRLLSLCAEPITVPAFSLKDLERCVPGDYVIYRSSNTYVLSCEIMYEIPKMRSDRLPDVFAMAVIELVNRKKYPIDYFNKKLVEIH